MADQRSDALLQCFFLGKITPPPHLHLSFTLLPPALLPGCVAKPGAAGTLRHRWWPPGLPSSIAPEPMALQDLGKGQAAQPRAHQQLWVLTRSPWRCDRSLQRGCAQGVPCRRCLRALCVSPARVGSVPSPCHPWKPFQQAQGMPGSGVYPPATGTVGPPPPHRCLLPVVFAQLQLSSSRRLPRSTKAAEPQPAAGFRAYQAYPPAQLSSSLAPLPFSPCGRTDPGPTRWPKRSQGCRHRRGCSHPCPFWGAPPAPQPSRKC